MGSHIEVKNLEDFLSSVEGGAFEKEKIRNKKDELLSAFLLYVIKIYPLWVQITKKNSENFSRGWKRHATLKI